jgi:hypothetical protein
MEAAACAPVVLSSNLMAAEHALYALGRLADAADALETGAGITR